MIQNKDLGIYYYNHKYRLKANLNYKILSNFVYLDTLANVQQHRASDINIYSAELSKDLSLASIHSRTRFVYQHSSNDTILSLPNYNLYQSLFFEHLTHFKLTGGELLWQLGVDYRFNSSYKADAYMPMAGMFYKNTAEAEAFHRFDFFINLTIKRARFYIKYTYLNSLINEKYYFNSPYYGSPEPKLQLGLAWTFYD